jgi:hypothetical protein
MKRSVENPTASMVESLPEEIVQELIYVSLVTLREDELASHVANFLSTCKQLHQLYTTEVEYALLLVGKLCWCYRSATKRKPEEFLSHAGIVRRLLQWQISEGRIHYAAVLEVPNLLLRYSLCRDFTTVGIEEFATELFNLAWTLDDSLSVETLCCTERMNVDIAPKWLTTLAKKEWVDLLKNREVVLLSLLRFDSCSEGDDSEKEPTELFGVRHTYTPFKKKLLFHETLNEWFVEECKWHTDAHLDGLKFRDWIGTQSLVKYLILSHYYRIANALSADTRPVARIVSRALSSDPLRAADFPPRVRDLYINQHSTEYLTKQLSLIYPTATLSDCVSVATVSPKFFDAQLGQRALFLALSLLGEPATLL